MAATDCAKATEQSYYKNDEDDCPNRHFSLRVFVVKSTFSILGGRFLNHEPGQRLTSNRSLAKRRFC
jgi:hypothetical protein